MLSVIVPFYNEKEMVTRFFSAVTPALEATGMEYEFICVDDGSTDGTLPLLKHHADTTPCVKVISLSRNFGKEIALAAGLDYATGKAVVIIDSDLQDPPDLIPLMVKKWQQGFQVVYGVRQKREGDSRIKRLTAGWFYRLYNRLGHIRIPENAGDFRLLDRQVVEVLRQMRERTRFTKGLYAWAGFSQTGIPFDRPERAAGQSKWNLWRLWNFALDGIFSFSTLPLRVWLYVGLAVSLLAFIYGSFLIIRTLVMGADVPGYASMMVAVLFIGGIQLVTLGIMGEYLGRIYKEVKGRPLYVVKEETGVQGR